MRETNQEICAFCAQYAFLLAMGYGKSEIGEALVTEQFPKGCTYQTLRAHEIRHRKEMASLVAWTNLVRRERVVSIKEITRQNVRDEMALHLGDAKQQVILAIQGGDTDKAVWLLEQFMGKATSKMEHSGAILHGHQLISQPEALTQRQDTDIEESIRMNRFLIEGEPIEAELVGETG